ncbi:hypothetical protein NDU88_002767 [Pleurodeles waltl]|uniref:Uncharacterized protein n=1 Tax=Pleurodeles waltl TaxID=8319 RepID=A0AAV7TP79_PLEWA|nr:hypothetical protein NDU88_002767 [Pleurodeles waltl]
MITLAPFPSCSLGFDASAIWCASRGVDSNSQGGIRGPCQGYPAAPHLSPVRLFLGEASTRFRFRAVSRRAGPAGRRLAQVGPKERNIYHDCIEPRFKSGHKISDRGHFSPKEGSIVP